MIIEVKKNKQIQIKLIQQKLMDIMNMKSGDVMSAFDIGDYVNFTKHLTKRIKIYFNSLKKLATYEKDSNKNWVYDTNNSFGIAETMSAEECAKMLFANGFRFNSVDSMIDRMETISKVIKGFEAFAKVAEDLRADVDLANELFTIFAKTRISKVTLTHKKVFDTTTNTFRESNTESDKATAMLFDLRNDARYAITKIKPENYTDTLVKYRHRRGYSDYLGDLISSYKYATNNKDIKWIKEIEHKVNVAIREITEITRAYFPSISELAIESYINNANDANGIFSKRINNLQYLVSILDLLNRKASDSVALYNSIQREVEKARHENAENRRKQRQGYIVSEDDFHKISNIQSQDYLEDIHSSIFQIRNLFIDYSIVEVNFNSTNADNKMSSDIINNSLITRITKLLESGNTDVLERWGNDKMRSHHYKFSNIFVETYIGGKQNGGKTYALFRETPTGLKVTDYALDLFKLSLFDGAKNADTGKSSTYSKMNIGDFTASVYAAYFNTERTQEHKTIPLASYFLRTPSDAPKTFVLRAPRYDTSDLYVQDKQEVDKFIKNVLKGIRPLGSSITDIYLDNFIRNSTVTLKGFRDILNNIKLLPYDEGANKTLSYFEHEEGTGINVIKIELGSKEENDYRRVYLVVKGNIKERGTKKYLKDISILAYKEYFNNQPTVGGMSAEVVDVIKDNIKWHLNKGHKVINGVTYDSVPVRTMNYNSVVFTQLRNKVKQELYNMLVAADYLFEREPYGRIKTEVKNGVRVPVLKKGLDINSLYDFYDKDKDGNVFKVEEGKVVLCGNVFNSNLFTLWVSKKDANGNYIEEKYKRNYLMEAITTDPNDSDDSKLNVLFGALDDIRAIRTEVDGKMKVTDIHLGDKAINIINQSIKNFIEDYIHKAQTKLKENKKFIAESISEENVIDFSLNYRLMLMHYDELFEGSSKFYEDTRTILKRAKEYQGSGVPYGIVDYFNQDGDKPDRVKTLINTGTITENIDGNQVKRTFQEIFTGTSLDGLDSTNRFKAVTIFNSKDTNHSALKVLSDKLISIGVDAATALELLYGKVSTDESGEIKYDDNGNIVSRGGFTGTKVNDAQSYITFREWVRRVAAKGQLKQYLPLIRRITNAEESGRDISVGDMTEFVQIQKNFYYDLHFDDERDMEAPRQIKNAEIVLIPSLVKGTQLEQVYNLMIECDIDQLNTKETSKAANKNVLRLWDNEGNISDEDIANFRAKCGNKNVMGVKQYYDYKYLYTQQETPQHLDDENKVGLQLVKKLIDNIPNTGHPLSDIKQEFLKLLSENIYSSYKELHDELDIKYNSDGSIADMNKKVFFEKLRQQLEIRGMDKNLYDCIDLDGDGNPKMPIIRADVLSTFESIVQSVFNRGVTRQTLPGFHAAQGTNIGWRALKDTVEHRAYDKDLHYHQDKSGKYVHYIEVKLPLSAFGIDRAVGRWKRMKDEEILEILQKEGLDEIIGYRIPTEGKQSAAIMKVVGFTPDAMGSTIIVPNDWVSQTGSDFDIDSVYGIMFNTYFDSDGNIHNIKYDKDKPATYKDYYRYLMHRINDLDISKETKEEIKNARNKIQEQLQVDYKIYKQQYADALKDIDPEPIEKEANRLFDEQGETEEVIKLDYIADKYKTLQTYINQCKELAQEEKHDKAKDYEIARHLYTNQALVLVLDRLNSIAPQDNEEAEAIKEVIPKIEAILNASRKLYNYYTNNVDINEEAAERIANIIESEVGTAKILTYSEWAAQPAYRRATRQERDNGILADMLEILKSPYSLEEQLSRSNFDGITDALDKMLPTSMKGERAARSPYDIYDQIAYQEDAMSGAMLKAISVSMDTFCSVCNNQQPLLRDCSEILVVYDRGDIDTADKAIGAFDTGKGSTGWVDKENKHFFIRHKQYGWSNSYKNVVNRILTSYSSQTTAHILDAIKAGTVPNVNLYTFGVYKTLANLGVDYNTIISFMAQPGIGRIVDKYNSNHSLFYGGASTPFEGAVKDIARELGIKFNNSDSVSSVLAQINDEYEIDFNALFRVDEDVRINLNDKNLEKLAIIASKLKDRLWEEGAFAESSPIEGNVADDAEQVERVPNNTNKLLFDLGVAMLFHKINKVAAEVTSVSMVTNPDKFGAGKSMYAANKIFMNIYKNIFYDDTTEAEPRDPILTVNGQHILEAMYPGCTDYANDKSINGFANRVRKGVQEGDIRQSSYMSLAAQLQCSTAFSVAVGEHLLYTQDPKFVELVYEIGKYLSDNFTKDVAEDIYNSYKNYILNYVYNTLPTINYPWVWSWNSKKKQLDVELVDIKDDDESNNKKILSEENKRVFGYDLPAELAIYEINDDDTIKRKVPFTAKDKNNPTDDEIKLFAKLSPAQKVKWIQDNSSDAGVFHYLEANLYNPFASRERVGMHTIQFNDTGIPLDTISKQFMNAVNSRNPFIRMAAMDLVKYAAKVEGFNFGKSTVTKIIDNDVLINGFGSKGYNFKADINAVFNAMQVDDGVLTTGHMETVAELYLRSNKDCKYIRTFKPGKSDFNLKKAGLTRITEGTLKGLYVSEFVFNPDDVKDNETQEKAFERQKIQYNEKLLAAGFLKKDRVHRTYAPNSYVRIQETNGTTMLYKIVSSEGVVIAYPLSNLQKNEITEWSANEDNNIPGLLSSSLYNKIITQIINEGYSLDRMQAIAAEIGNT